MIFLIEVRDLHKSFGDLEVLKGVDLSVDKSEVVSIIGGSGSGKSTLLRCLNFLEKKNSGDIIIEGEVMDGSEQQKIMLRQKVGMVFQQFDLFPHMTVIDNVMSGPRIIKKMEKKD